MLNEWSSRKAKQLSFYFHSISEIAWSFWHFRTSLHFFTFPCQNLKCGISDNSFQQQLHEKTNSCIFHSIMPYFLHPSQSFLLTAPLTILSSNNYTKKQVPSFTASYHISFIRFIQSYLHQLWPSITFTQHQSHSHAYKLPFLSHSLEIMANDISLRDPSP